MVKFSIQPPDLMEDPHCFLCDKPHSKAKYFIKSTPPYDFYLCEDCAAKIINQFPVKNPAELELEKLREIGEKLTSKN